MFRVWERSGPAHAPATCCLRKLALAAGKTRMGFFVPCPSPCLVIAALYAAQAADDPLWQAVATGPRLALQDFAGCCVCVIEVCEGMHGPASPVESLMHEGLQLVQPRLVNPDS